MQRTRRPRARKRSWRTGLGEISWPVMGKEWNRITSVANAKRKAFSAFFRGSNTCPSFIRLRPSSAPSAVGAIVALPKG